MYPSKKVQITQLKVNKAPTEVLSKYADFVDVFLPKSTLEFPKHTGVYDHAIELVDNWQPLYGPIYSLDQVKLEKLKTYIKNNLVNNFIKSFKSLARTLIFFDKKSDKSLRLCVNYQSLNNLTIKNRYSLSLIGESLD